MPRQGPAVKPRNGWFGLYAGIFSSFPSTRVEIVHPATTEVNRMHSFYVLPWAWRFEQEWPNFIFFSPPPPKSDDASSEAELCGCIKQSDAFSLEICLGSLGWWLTCFSFPRDLWSSTGSCRGWGAGPRAARGGAGLILACANLGKETREREKEHFPFLI